MSTDRAMFFFSTNLSFLACLLVNFSSIVKVHFNLMAKPLINNYEFYADNIFHKRISLIHHKKVNCLRRGTASVEIGHWFISPPSNFNFIILFGFLFLCQSFCRPFYYKSVYSDVLIWNTKKEESLFNFKFKYWFKI
jgi:hypothetical protein